MSTTDANPTSSGPIPRQPIRSLLPNLYLGRYQPGPNNTLTDIPGVLVSCQSIHSSPLYPSAPPGSLNTGVTTILPRKDWFHRACFASIFRFNGSGELTGSHWLDETGLLRSPIVLTGSLGVGNAYNGIYEYGIREYAKTPGSIDWFLTPVVGETYDGFLHDIAKFAVEPRHVVKGVDNASSEPVPMGNTGGGTGMICHWFKGGTGSSSRVVPRAQTSSSNGENSSSTFTIAALVQANYGKMWDLKIGGAPVGRILHDEQGKLFAANPGDEKLMKQAQMLFKVADAKDKKDGSIIVILGTDAPLHPTQLERLAKRATIGLARVGGYGVNPSGDIFLAFSTGAELNVSGKDKDGKPVDVWAARTVGIEMVEDQTINALFEAAADCVEEAIYNALCCAETMTGFGNTIEAINLERVREIMQKYL